MAKDFILPVLELYKLNLSDERDFLLALHYASHFDKKVEIDESAWTKNRELLSETHPLFTSDGPVALVTKAVWYFFMNYTPDNHATYGRGWLAVFRKAFDDGVINAVAYGAALRCMINICSMAPANLNPWHFRDETESLREIIAEMRRAAPEGITRSNELQELDTLRDRITVYRGGCSTLDTYDSAKASGAKGLFWTPHHDIAVYFLGVRVKARRREGKVGWPFLLKAEIDKSAVLGLGLFGRDSDMTELYVDFDQIDDSTVECVLPHEVRKFADEPERVRNPSAVKLGGSLAGLIYPKLNQKMLFA